MWHFICFEALIIMLAVAVDLAAGLYKAKLRGEVRNSEGIKRTISKFILYFGSLCIAAGMDSIFYMSQFWERARLSAMAGVPVIATAISLLLLATELRSVWEKADKKQRSEAFRTAQALSAILDKDFIRSALKEAVKQLKTDEDGERENAEGLQE